jgi:hypothetical protein
MLSVVGNVLFVVGACGLAVAGWWVHPALGLAAASVFSGMIGFGLASLKPKGKP